MKKITFLFLFLITTLSYGQLSLDFEDGTTTTQFNFNGVGSGNIANPQINADNMSSRVLEVTKPAGSQWFAGCGFQEAPDVAFVNIADGDMFTVKIYSSLANVPFRVRLQAGLDTGSGPAPSFNYDFTTGAADQWIEYTLDFSGQVSGTEQYREIVIQPDYDPACEGVGCPDITVGGTYLIDDFEQVGQTVDPNTDATLSDLTLDGNTISGFSSNTFTYNIDLPSGTTNAPTVAGIASEAGNGSSNVSVTQATGVPGTATLDVTAPNGTNMQTYTVNFGILIEDPTEGPVNNGSTGNDFYIYSELSGNANSSSFTNFNLVDFSGGAIITQPVLNGDTVLRADNIDFFGSGLGEIFNATSGSTVYDFVHLNYYATTSTGFNFSLVDQSLAAAGICCGSADEPFYRFGTGGDAPLIVGQWVSVFIPLSHFADETVGLSAVWDGTDIQQTLITGNGTVFFDNIFFSTANTLSSNDFELSDLQVSPNPTKDSWEINSINRTIESIEVFDILGKNVLSLTPNATEVSIDASALITGIYLARVTSQEGTQTLRLVKN